jgi:hypothetical protein
MQQAAAESMQPTVGQASAIHPEVSSIASTIGNPGEMHVQYAAALLATIPAPVSSALAMQQGAAALMLALVLDQDPDVRTLELEVIRQSPHQQLEPEVLRLVEHLDTLHARYRLPLFDMAMPELKGLEREEKQSLIDTVKAVIDADRKIKLDELTIYVLVKERLSVSAGRIDRVKYRMLHDLKEEITLLLSLLAYLGKSEQHTPAEIFKASAGEIAAALPDLELQNPRTFKPENIISALDKFNGLTPPLKGLLVAACIKAVLFDDDVSIRELELMRGLCTVMEVPMPPVLMEHT